MHSMVMTPNHIVLIAEPLYMKMGNVLRGEPLGLGGLITTDDNTIFQVVSRKDGSVRSMELPGFIFGHVINSWEEGDDILFDLTWYAAGNSTTMGWFNRWFLKYMSDPVVRENWPRAQVMRYRLSANNTASSWRLFADEEGLDDFETPKINEAFNGHKNCIVYFMQFHSYDYTNASSYRHGTPESGPFGAVGIAKRNLCSGERQGWYAPNQYPSEVQFLPDPSGTNEDDGILLSMVFDANTNSSLFQILDARTMERLAMAPLPIKTPFLIHSSFFPDK
jgi:carotenoid cleavage dioxygenase-like enzyme